MFRATVARHTALRTVQSCMIAGVPSCLRADYPKHNPYSGMTRADTRRPNPARYAEGVGIEAEERTTIALPGFRGGTPPTKTEYLRDAALVLGWDDERDAQWSFVECTRVGTGRGFHGRPMHASNRKRVKMARAASVKP